MVFGVVVVGFLGFVGGYYGNIDFEFLWLVFGYIFKYLGIVGYVIVCFFFLVIL